MKESFSGNLVGGDIKKEEEKYDDAMTRRKALKIIVGGLAALATGKIFNTFDEQDKALEQEKLNAKEEKPENQESGEVTVPQIKNVPERNDGKPGVGGYNKDLKI
ncbi:MAG: hypothetical protein US81_C0018G0008 [Parcubacteria group bacterium GW2011_GWE2_38_18]|nr:MAG: hypothetical protein US81_C0018G0008 [Parcubacteria group bacterium GW2011_GWE2_38_18]